MSKERLARRERGGGGEERAGVVGALLTYCKGPGKGNSVLADLLSLWQS